MALLGTYRFIAKHPLTRRHKLQALKRWVSWQIGSRVTPHSQAIPFFGTTRLMMRSGLTGATGNLYCGLHEFEDMAFVLHFLRAGDLMVDVGANIGSYSVLAATTGASVISFEPAPQTFETLLDNVNLNRFQSLITPCNQAVGLGGRRLRFTTDQDTTNKVIADGASYPGTAVDVDEVSLDAAMDGMTATLIKIDVEGFEAEVLQGAAQTLQKAKAVVMETNGSGIQFGHDDASLLRTMQEFGFTAWRYAPLERKLHRLGDGEAGEGNTLFLRDPERAQELVGKAPATRILDVTF